MAQSVKIFNHCFDHDNNVKQHRYCLKNAGFRAQFESYGRQKYNSSKQIFYLIYQHSMNDCFEDRGPLVCVDFLVLPLNSLTVLASLPCVSC